MKKVLLAVLILSGSFPSVWAAQLDAKIMADDDTISPSFSFLRIIYIEYTEGGEIAQLLRGENQNITFTANSNTSDMKELINQINENLKSLPSTVIVTAAKVNYQALLTGNQNSAVLEVKLNLIPTLSNPVIKQKEDARTIDANWRGITLDSPILLETQYGILDINNPKEVLKIMIPNVMEKFGESNVEILELPLVDSTKILELPLYRWHSLFDNTAIIASAEIFNFTGKHVLTYYSMGECNFELGLCQDREWIQELELDKKYKIVMIESRDDASITIEGYSEFSSLGSIETFEASLSAPVSEKPATNEFPAMVMYSMASLAAVGGISMFFFSSRKLKKDQDQGQTGIDPAHLIVYETSNSAGGYKTNRGEAYIENLTISKMPVSQKI
ncbi:MAG TPA: hypothetical protein VMW74_03580 [Nitrosopumilaceae archaeon]|nr:hypothetical protein [Nitrosopumilaceae archaeon]